MQVNEASASYLALVERQDVPQGYKKTEVGVIPEDWDVKVLGDLFSFSGGLSASREQLSSEGCCYLHYGDIHKSAKNFIDVRAEYLDIPKLDIPFKRVSAKSRLTDGDVVFVDASEDDEGTSKHVVVVNNEKIPYISGLHTIVAKSKTASLDNVYKRYCFQTRDIKRQFYFYAVGTKVSGISKTNIAKIFIPVPPVPEQCAIAEALSDVDGLIAALDKLIAKKRAIKQAAMQQLLTGKTRLPGFNGEWETKRLGEIGNFLKGSGVTRDNAQSGALACVRYGEIYTHHQDYIRTFYSRISEEVAATATRLQKGDLLFAGSGETKEEIGKCVAFISDEEAYAGGDIVILRPRGVDSLFMGYSLNTSGVNHQKASYGQGDAVVHISATALAQVSLSLPKLEEQTAIATILADMDANIAALEARRGKTRALKQGMMQQLLTGRIRLVSSKEGEAWK
jgi:type I restriction enzyme S subunit